MRFKLLMTALVATAALSGTAHAQDPAPGGEYSASLGRMIASMADGECPPDLMAADLLTACNDQIAQIGPALQSLGPVKDMNFVSAEGEGESRVETYDVFFESGQMLTWGIGGYVDGKFTIAYVGG